MTECVVFWQRMLTPHMTELAREIARLGFEVHYVTEEVLSAERRAMGWVVDDLAGVEVHYVDGPGLARDLVDRLPSQAVHITQGVRANGLVAAAQKRIMAKGLRHYPIMEKVDLRGCAGRIKPLVYALRFRFLSSHVEGVLAIGEGTKEWIAECSPSDVNPIPFAYFLKGALSRPLPRETPAFRFIFVGSLVGRKRVDMLLAALSKLEGRAFEVEIAGDGPDRGNLERMANEALPNRVVFHGTLEMTTAVARIAGSDCLVLPSDMDGWGAVVSEALINGTPAVCSSECGAAGAVRASGIGSVFQAGDVEGLRRCLAAMLDRGPPSNTERERLAAWADCLTAGAGARYLLEILDSSDAKEAIAAPWERGVP